MNRGFAASMLVGVVFRLLCPHFALCQNCKKLFEGDPFPNRNDSFGAKFNSLLMFQNGCCQLLFQNRTGLPLSTLLFPFFSCSRARHRRMGSNCCSKLGHFIHKSRQTLWKNLVKEENLHNPVMFFFLLLISLEIFESSSCPRKFIGEHFLKM